MSLSIQISRALKRVEASNKPAPRRRIRASEDNESGKFDLDAGLSLDDALKHVEKSLKDLDLSFSPVDKDPYMYRVFVRGEFENLSKLKDYFKGAANSKPSLLGSQPENYIIFGDDMNVTVSLDVGAVLIEKM